ncbi:MAG: RNA-binding protein [Pseudomonadota bacterium]|uniref:RNA-binding protein n=1 Tax=Polaromonas sp. TaxID=1869339 RepID=UPI001850543A|nr:RNA-binding protein [Polaromonas sp.]MBA3592359.1 RNA-binding protein [Polaromonas sp.]MDQ3272021.1 RNA-binding protein [Pseudomonadota bacterium]
MKTFELIPKMVTMGGVFYPTGYAVMLFADSAQAQQAADALEANGFAGDTVMLLPPETILHDIGKVDGDSGGMPSVGTEGHTVNKYVALARQGHHGVMVHAPDDEDTQRVLSAVRGQRFVYGQKYHMLAMEDLEPVAS